MVYLPRKVFLSFIIFLGLYYVSLRVSPSNFQYIVMYLTAIEGGTLPDACTVPHVLLSGTLLIPPAHIHHVGVNHQ